MLLRLTVMDDINAVEVPRIDPNRPCAYSLSLTAFNFFHPTLDLFVSFLIESPDYGNI